MARILPLFPLNIVVFPGEKLNLHIFEPRYKKLILDCQADDGVFGIPPFLKNGVSAIGTEVKILSIEKEYTGGEMDIKTEGIGTFRIDEFFQKYEDKDYAAGKVIEIENIEDEDVVIKTRITELLHELYETLGLSKLSESLPEDFRVFDIAHHIGLTTEQEFEILISESESTRQEIVLEHLLKVVPVIEETEKLKERVKQNGHFKNLIPPNF